MALICFSVINKPVVNFCQLSTGFPPHTYEVGHTRGVFLAPGDTVIPPDIRGPIILLLHLASRETLDRLSWRETATWPPRTQGWCQRRGWKATWVSDRVQAEGQQSTGRARAQCSRLTWCHRSSHLDRAPQSSPGTQWEWSCTGKKTLSLRWFYWLWS